MAIFEPFTVIRPHEPCAAEVCAPPYDIVDRTEASVLAKDRPHSFLRISRAEIELPEVTDPYSDEVYRHAAHNLREWISQGILVKEPSPCYLIYRQITGSHMQTGLVGLASAGDYEADRIKKHELTRKDKLKDRTRHIETCSAHAEPVFLTYRSSHVIDVTIKKWISEHDPLFDFTDADGTVQQVWRVDEADAIEVLRIGFESVPALYIADGHHRAASAVAVARNRRTAGLNAGAEGFMAVCFPSFDLKIMDYNRIVADLNGYTVEEFLAALRRARFQVQPVRKTMRKPEKKRQFGLYIGGSWYILKDERRELSEDPIDGLDVSILQNRILSPLLGIQDPRTDEHIDFIGGVRGLRELEQAVNSGRAAAAFALCPLSMDELLAAADAGRTMPPKSTWFEPKLASGLFVHSFE